MKNIILVVAFLLGMSSLCISQTDSSLVVISNKFLDHLIKLEYDSAYADFDKSVSDKLPVKKLKEVWGGFDKQFGKLNDHSKISVGKQSGYDMVITTLVWEKTSLDMTLMINATKKIVGFYFKPAATKEFAKVPAYANLTSFVENPIEIKSGEYSLPGILSFPKDVQKSPLVILVHGSGPNDKDETIGPNKVFRDIAYGLATKGIAVIRYEKRTKVYSAEMAQMMNLTVMEETIDDVVSSVALAKKIPGVDSTKIFVAGHSLGAMLAPRIASLIPDLAGIIMLAGNSRPLEDLVVEQYEYIFGLDGLSDIEKENIFNIKKQVEKLHSKSFNVNTPAIELPLRLPASYWWDLNNYNQKEVASKLKLPILILQGERDYQVTMTDFAGWKKAIGKNLNVMMISFPELNHLFMEGTEKSTPSEYEKAGNVSVKIIESISDWIKKH